jgi:light-regulated signal transduction histidine kinase (bacteriophytochrome)
LTRSQRYERIETQAALDEVLANLSKAVEEKGAEAVHDGLPPVMFNRTLMESQPGAGGTFLFTFPGMGLA